MAAHSAELFHFKDPIDLGLLPLQQSIDRSGVFQVSVAESSDRYLQSLVYLQLNASGAIEAFLYRLHLFALEVETSEEQQLQGSGHLSALEMPE